MRSPLVSFSAAAHLVREYFAMRFRHDQRAKQLASRLLEGFGETTTSEEVLADSQQIDVWHLPNEGSQDRARLGMFGRMTESACLLEPYHEPPDDDALRECIRKHLSFHHARVLKARAGGGKAVVPLATCWIVSSGRSVSALPAFGFAPAGGWPRGIYATPPGFRVNLVVLTELPRSRDTLLLRLLGRGAVLQHALHDLLALPEGSWERAATFPIFARLRFDLPQDPHDRTAEEEELVVTSQQMVEALQREAAEQATEKAMEKAFAHQFERRLKRALRDDERACLRKRTETLGPERVGDIVLDLSEAELEAWLADPDAH
jgi:hypothetical protein